MTEQPSPDRGAFHGDPGIRQRLLDTLRGHVAAGTLVFDGATWDGKRGSPMGVAIEGDDPAAYAAAYGYPLPLAGVLDLLIGGIDGQTAASAAAIDWVETVVPGADLTQVPARLVRAMLDNARAIGAEGITLATLDMLHGQDLAGDPPNRDEWRQVREALLTREATGNAIETAVTTLCEAAAWPATRGRSTVAAVFSAWRHLRWQLADPSWTAEDAARTRALLQGFWDDHAAERAADQPISYQALLEAADSDLARRHMEYLRRSNGEHQACGAELAAICLACFIEAPQLIGCAD